MSKHSTISFPGKEWMQNSDHQYNCSMVDHSFRILQRTTEVNS